MKEFIEDIKTLVASHFALYLKTQSYHWHVKGPHFLSLHKLFEEQYRELFESLDDLAEKLVMLGETVPSSLGKLNDRNLCEPANQGFCTKFCCTVRV